MDDMSTEELFLAALLLVYATLWSTSLLIGVGIFILVDKVVKIWKL
jgi:hypothetical protein